MVELELVGLSEDGRQLVLADAAGDEFVVPLDGRLRALVRNGRVPTGQLESSMESAQAQSALRPRDIQARIRAGQTPESVAEIAQVPVDKIMSYAVPVMAERQHMAERAQRSAVRRRNTEGPTLQLWDAVALQLRTEQVDPMSCQWDAWRREDGRWTVTASYRVEQGERTGTFAFDALSRYAVADDDEARWLVGEQEREETVRAKRKPSRQASGSRGGDSGKPAARRLSAVASEYDAMLFEDEESTTDLTAVADALGEYDEAPPEPPARLERKQPKQTKQPKRTGETKQPAGRTTAGDEVPSQSTRKTAQQRGQHPRPEKRGRRGRGRASVPSWDEIMFGQPKS
jgi:hypothetical protein